MENKNRRPFEIQFDESKGCFYIQIFKKNILGTKLTARIGKREAMIKNIKRQKGKDKDGRFELWKIGYLSPGKKGREIKCTIKIRSGYAVFETKINFESKETKSDYVYGNPDISFPSFEGENWESDCSCLSYKRQAPFNYPQIWQGKVTESLREGKNIPLIVTNKKYETIVLSPLNHLLVNTVSITHKPNRVSCGIPRAVTGVRKGTKVVTILVYGSGVNRTMDEWGNQMRKYYSVDPVAKDSDVLLKYISYWTNAGSAYWYRTPKKESYEETLRKLKSHHDQIRLNFGSYQLDSWWYQKDGDEYNSGIVDWNPKWKTNALNFNSMFPFKEKYRQIELFQKARMSYVQSFLNKPIGAHFKQISNESVYVQKEPNQFIIDDFAMPKNKKVAKKMFLDIFNHQNWGLGYIVHDWLSYMNDHHLAFRDIKVGRDYLTALDQACLKSEAPMNKSGHLAIQFCMSQPHMTLASVQMESVTTIRSTSDSNSFFVEGTKRWWWHLYSGKLIQSLGKYPFYDNRHSAKSHLHPFAAYSKFEFIWICLSCGPLGIGDKLGQENMKLIRRCIKYNGEIIKPDIPAIPMDKCFLYNPFTVDSNRGVATYSFSKIKAGGDNVDETPAVYSVYYLLVFNTNPLGKFVQFNLMLAELEAVGIADFAVYNYFTEELRTVPVALNIEYRLKRRDFYYEIIAPIKQGIAVIGDVTKHVSMSNQVIECLTINCDSCVLVINYFDINETSRYLFYLENKPCEVLLNGAPIDYEYDSDKLTIILNWKNVDLDKKQTQTLEVWFVN